MCTGAVGNGASIQNLKGQNIIFLNLGQAAITKHYASQMKCYALKVQKHIDEDFPNFLNIYTCTCKTARMQSIVILSLFGLLSYDIPIRKLSSPYHVMVLGIWATLRL